MIVQLCVIYSQNTVIVGIKAFVKNRGSITVVQSKKKIFLEDLELNDQLPSMFLNKLQWSFIIAEVTMPNVSGDLVQYFGLIID